VHVSCKLPSAECSFKVSIEKFFLLLLSLDSKGQKYSYIKVVNSDKLIYNENTILSALIDSSNEVCLEVYTGETKYIWMSLHHNAGKNHNLKTANEQFKNLGSSNMSERQ
jgi:hypothetical protein